MSGVFLGAANEKTPETDVTDVGGLVKGAAPAGWLRARASEQGVSVVSNLVTDSEHCGRKTCVNFFHIPWSNSLRELLAL